MRKSIRDSINVFSLLFGIAVWAVILDMGGCAALKGPQAEQKSVVTACNGYASALATAAAFRAQGKLSTSQVNAINNVISIAHPICSASTIPNTQTALAQVETATAQLAAVNAKVKK